MVSLSQLVLPILLAAVLVFLVSFLVHMVLGYHKSDMKGLPNEEAARQTLGAQKLTPGQYAIPYCPDMSAMKDPAIQQRWAEGPVAILTVLRSGPMRMGPMLVQWFVYCLVISFFVAYLTGRVLAPGTDYLHVFQVAGTAAWLGYAGATISQGIWMGRPWSTVWKDVFDGLLYGLVTAGAFGWLWPR